MTFSEFSLAAPLLRAITDAGFTAPTPIQASALPVALTGRDIIGTASTGTGKTAAFVLPILQRLLDKPSTSRKPRVLVLTPTRELSEQILGTFESLGVHTRIRVATVYGGVGFGAQEQALRGGVPVIVACPGRLLDHMQRGTADLSGIEVLVLDEADRMLDMGFLPSVRRILAALPRQRQTMMFSATFAPEVAALAKDSLKDPARVDVGVGVAARTVAHALYPAPSHLKTPLLLALLEKIDSGSVLVFTRTKHRANRLLRQLEAAGHRGGVLHGNRSQNQRQAALEGFRAGTFRLLVATDIAARGLDIEGISHVINYDIPDTADTYIHRIGRTGRAERDGDALTLISQEDAEMVRDIERALKAPIERRTVEGFDYHQAAPPRMPEPPRQPSGGRPGGRRQGSPAPGGRSSARGPSRPSRSASMGDGGPRPAGRSEDGRGLRTVARPASSSGERGGDRR